MATIEYADHTDDLEDSVAERMISTAIFREGFVRASMHGYTLRMEADGTATLEAPGTPGLSEPTIYAGLSPEEARGTFLYWMED